VSTAVDYSGVFNAVADYAAVAMRADRRQSSDGALEAIEYVLFTVEQNFEALVIRISACFTCSHYKTPEKQVFSTTNYVQNA
jgi:hypothetical protein